MKKLIFISLIANLLFLLSSADEITLKEYFELVKKNNPNYKKATLSKKIFQASQNKFLGKKNFRIFNHARYYKHELATGFPTEPNKVDGYSITTGIDKRFWQTGGTFTALITNSKINAEAVLYNSRFTKNGISLSYSQPLLKNFGGKLSKLPYKLAGYHVKIKAIEEFENKEELLINFGQEFVICALLFQKLTIMNKRHSFAISQSKQLKKKLDQNMVEKVDLLRAQSLEKLIEQQKMMIESEFISSRIKVSIIAGSKKILNQNIVYDFSKSIELPNIQTVIYKIKNTSRLIKMVDILMKQYYLKLSGTKNKGKPKLDININAQFEDGSEKFNDSTSLDKPSYSAGITFSHPIGNTTNKQELLKVRLELERIKLEKRNIEQLLESNTRTLISKIKFSKKIADLGNERILINTNKTIEEMKSYNTGKTQFSTLIQSQDEEQEAKFSYLENAAKYHGLLLHFYALTDKLVPSN
ncbi:MAG: hypothetical protein COA79_06355 [Planctomycetota bacterium]|nr:MAG: hypothetical protein COA79_06355 [Planctomycetota bacterium]